MDEQDAQAGPVFRPPETGMRRIAVIIIGIFMALGIAAVSADASTLPAMGSNATGWSHPHVRPAAIYVGNGGAPFVLSLSWSHWNQASAYGLGRLHLNAAVHSVGVTLSRPRLHSGREWFTRMNWSYHTRAGVRKVIHWVLTSRGYWDYG